MVNSKNKDYKFPGGGVKKYEEKLEALKREVEEETGYV
ncbi:NUDIX domain-containing protein, partial [Clostridium neonatale]